MDMNGNVLKVIKVAIIVAAQVEVEESVTRIDNEFAISTRDISGKSITVANGAQLLGATTEEMNAAVEELSTSIDSIVANSKEAYIVAICRHHEADMGSKAIERSNESMGLINNSSEDITEYRQVISEIASQTNL